jgi:hypothetical protein
MAEVVQDTHQDFWRSPTVLEAAAVEAAIPVIAADRAETCADCGAEFMIGARFCHTCGRRRPLAAAPGSDATVIASLWFRSLAAVQLWTKSATTAWHKISFPDWVQYLHFHEIKRSIGLPTAALVAFILGLGCVAGAIGVSLFYKASTLAEFQAIQMWRIEWLLAATASFVAGILLKKPSGGDSD